MKRAITQFWGSGLGGKYFLAEKLLDRLPEHTVYVEPFVGAGSVFFGKSAVGTEWINDLDVQVARAYQDIKALTEAQFSRLEHMDWKPDQVKFANFRVEIEADEYDADPVLTLYRFLYLKRFSFQRQMKQFAVNVPPPADYFPRMRAAHKRLKRVKVTHVSANNVLADVAAHSNVFAYLDPPYPGTGQKVRSKDLIYSFDDLAGLADLLQNHFNGLFMMSVADNPRTREILAPFQIEEIETRRTAGLWRKDQAVKMGIELLVSNFYLE